MAPSDWTDPTFLASAESWIRASLGERDLAVLTIEQRHIRPWATAMRIRTSSGVFWFKAARAEPHYEAEVIRALARNRPLLAPELIASDDIEGWLLTRNGGPTFRDYYGEPLPDPSRAGEVANSWAQVLAGYAELQLASAKDLAPALAAGLPQQPLADISPAYEQLLTSPLIRDRASSVELARLEALVPRVAAAADLLEALALPETIQHDDLHSANVLVPALGRFLIFDWGDAELSHPFLSLRIALGSLADSVGVPFEDGTAVRILKRHFEPYLDVWRQAVPALAGAQGWQAVDAALLLAAPARAESWLGRLAQWPEAEERYLGVPMLWLRELLERDWSEPA